MQVNAFSVNLGKTFVVFCCWVPHCIPWILCFQLFVALLTGKYAHTWQSVPSDFFFVSLFCSLYILHTKNAQFYELMNSKHISHQLTAITCNQFKLFWVVTLHFIYFFFFFFKYAMDDAAVWKMCVRGCCSELCSLHTKDLSENVWATSHWIDPKNECHTWLLICLDTEDTVIHLTVKNKTTKMTHVFHLICIESLWSYTETLTHTHLVVSFLQIEWGLIHNIVGPDASHMQRIVQS